MCGRFTRIFQWQDVWAFGCSFRGPAAGLVPSYNVAPKSVVPVMYHDEQGPIAGLMRWWLVPHWSKTAEIRYATFNAKSEEARTKPAFRGPFKHRRCVIPASGFYEWKKIDEKRKQPYYIVRADGGPMYFAGLWDVWNEELRSCTVLTTSPNREMAALHDRMPCVLERDRLAEWLDTEATPSDRAQELLGPAADGVLTACPVDRRVGNSRHDDPGLIQPID